MYWIVVLFGFVCCSTHGFPHGDRRRAPVKRSDYSMYDNQFFSVGDTPLDNEVTNCGLVRHQYARGYIRLREYLERMQGCGRKGKLKNMAGIAASTKDDDDFTSDSFHIPSHKAVTTSPFKPRPIGLLIDNTDKQGTQVQAYNHKVKNLRPELPFQQQALQRSQTEHPSFNNLGFITQENSALSYRQNNVNRNSVLPTTRKFISRENLNANPLQSLNAVNSVKNRQQYYSSPDPQRYYSEQSPGIKHAYNGPIAVGQPLLRPNPLAFHQQASGGSSRVLSKPVIPQGDQPNPDLDLNKDNKVELQKQQIKAQAGIRHEAVPDPVNLVLPEKDDQLRDDFEGHQEGVKDEATKIGSIQSDPIPSQTSFTENPKLEDEEKIRDSENKIDDDNNGHSSKTKLAEDHISEKSSKMGKHDGLDPAEKSTNTDTNTDDSKDNPQDYIQSDDRETIDQSEHKLNEFLKPDSSNNDDIDRENDVKSTDDKQESNSFAKETAPSAKSEVRQSDKGGISINLDVLKNKITSTKDVGFLKRMLTLIKKITHHKDFHKLAGIQKNAIMQAGNAVNNAVAKEANTQRSIIQPRPGYYGHPVDGRQPVNSYVSSLNHPHPPRWNPGDRTIVGSTHAQFYKAGQSKISKKFQIESPYYQQPRRVSYTPPYYSLQRLNYGIYNGNIA